MILFLKIVLAHILGDFVFQPEKWVKNKEKKKIKSPKLYLHILVHVFFLGLLLEFDFNRYATVFLLIISSHFFFDVLKLYLQNKKTKRIWFFLDQILHLLMMFLTVSLVENISFNFKEIYTKNNLAFIISVLLITSVSSIFIKMIINKWNPESKKENQDSLASAGKYIGILERLFVFVFVITNHWEAIGFLLAAKSVFRFGDLKDSKDRKLTEYILIGTLVSFGISILIGILYLHLTNSL